MAGQSSDTSTTSVQEPAGQSPEQTPDEGSLAPNLYNFFEDEDFSELDRDEPPAEPTDPEKPAGDPPTGETPSEPPAPSGEKPGEKKEEPPAEPKEKDPPKEPDKPKEPEKPPEKKDEPPKPPPGYVPNQALQEERSKRQTLSQELFQAKQRLAELEAKATGTAGKGDDEFKDFKVLSDKEVEALWDEDPKEAALYQNRLIRYQDHQRRKADEQNRQRSLEAERKQIVASAYEAMNSVVPELFDPSSDVNAALTKHAADQGLSTHMAAVLTDPQTVIQARDKDGNVQSFVLGQGAAEVLALIANTHKAISSTDVEAVKKQVAEETEKRVREEVTKELTEKFKNMSGGEEGLIFQSLGDATPKDDGELGVPPDSEEGWFGLPEDQRRKFLGG